MNFTARLVSDRRCKYFCGKSFTPWCFELFDARYTILSGDLSPFLCPRIGSEKREHRTKRRFFRQHIPRFSATSRGMPRSRKRPTTAATRAILREERMHSMHSTIFPLIFLPRMRVIYDAQCITQW